MHICITGINGIMWNTYALYAAIDSHLLSSTTEASEDDGDTVSTIRFYT